MHTRRIVVVTFVALLMVGGVACSKKSETASTDTSAVSGTSSSVASSTTASSSDGDATTTTKSSSSGGPCPTQAEVDASSSHMDLSAPGADVATMRAELEKAMEAQAKYLPDNLKADYETVKEAWKTYFDKIEAVGTMDMAKATPDQQQQLMDATAILSTPEFVQATKNIAVYFETTCPDINFDSSSSSPSGG